MVRIELAPDAICLIVRPGEERTLVAEIGRNAKIGCQIAIHQSVGDELKSTT